jgi:hypothetical protein
MAGKTSATGTARNIVKLWLLFPCALLCSCATRSPSVPFVQPSTTPIKQAHAIIQKEHLAAKQHIAVTANDLNQILDACPQAKAIIAQAQFNLSEARDSVDAAEAARAQAEGARDQLDLQLKDQTDTCNAVARDYESSKVQINSLNESRHGWVKRFWIVSGLLVAAGIWIFKGPLLALTGIGI